MRKNTIPNFIEKTFDILQDDYYKDIISWTPSGYSFIVLDRQKLCQKILPVYFKHANFSSFVRQLNMYNFHKKRNNEEKLEFYHKLFRKDRKQLLIGLKRKPSQAQILYGDQLIAKLNDENDNKAYQENKFFENSFDYQKNSIQGNQKKRPTYCFQIPIEIIKAYKEDQEKKKIDEVKNQNNHRMETENQNQGFQFSISMASEENNSQGTKQRGNNIFMNSKPWEVYEVENFSSSKFYLNQENKQFIQKEQFLLTQNINTLNSKLVLINSDLSNRGNRMQNKPSSIKVIPNIFIKLPPTNLSQNYL